MQKTYFNWSTGKDSALALFHLLKDNNYTIEKLLTSVNADFDRVSMHGIRRSLLEKQVQALNIPFETIELRENATMKSYEEVMTEAILKLKSGGFTTAAFGDIFLEDLKKYREEQLNKFEIKSVFPLWKRNTTELIEEFIDSGFKSIIVACDDRYLGKSFVGRTIDHEFLKDLPKNVDPCGENGEFHTFCFDGPIFENQIDFKIGKTISIEYDSPENSQEKIKYWFLDLI